MRIELDLYRPDELRIFGEFCEKLADNQAERDALDRLPARAGDCTERNPLMQRAVLEQSGDPRVVGSVTQHTIADTPVGGIAVIDPLRNVVEQPAPTKRGRKPKTTEPTPNIQAEPENRVDPATEAQDAADEAAEKTQEQGRPLSHDDVRAAMKTYLDTYGSPAAMEDGPKILGVAKISAIPDEQEKLREAIDNVASAVANNPFKREAVAA